jgi:integrase/recombinase XerC
MKAKDYGYEKLEYDPLPYMQEYLDELGAALRHPKYINLNRVALGHFKNFCTRQGIDSPLEVKRGDILKYQTWVNAQDWSDGYKYQMLKCVRAWFRWQEDLAYIDRTPFIRIKFSQPEKKPNPLTKEDLETILYTHKTQFLSADPFIYHRREMMLAVMLGWGLRRFEVVSLNNTQFDTRRDYITVRNKGGDTKNLPYSAEMKKIYLGYERQRTRYAIPEDDALFITRDGTRIGDSQVYDTITEIGRRAGITVHPHMLRDTAGTMMLNADMPVERVAKILGHKNIKQTLAYAKIHDESLARDFTATVDPALKLMFRKTSRQRKEAES